MATASLNGRSAEAVRREIEAERRELATAVEQLRDGLGLRTRLPLVAAGALGAGFFLAGGVGATMRFLARKGRER
jgi:hypothetical protein